MTRTLKSVFVILKWKPDFSFFFIPPFFFCLFPCFYSYGFSVFHRLSGFEYFSILPFFRFSLKYSIHLWPSQPLSNKISSQNYNNLIRSNYLPTLFSLKTSIWIMLFIYPDKNPMSGYTARWELDCQPDRSWGFSLCFSVCLCMSVSLYS